MTNGKIPIRFFEILDDIREVHGIQYQEWAKQSGIENPRISELKTLAAGTPINRALSLEKFFRLLSGLDKILGGDIVKKEMAARLQKAGTVDEKIMLLTLTLLSDPEKSDKEKLLLFLEVLTKNK
jgi:hypothetical protein